MIRYFLRCIEADYPVMLALGVKLGMITIPQEPTDELDEEGNPVLAPNYDLISAIDGAWDYIGHIPEPTGETAIDEEGNEYPVMAPKADANGNPYIHVNMLSKLDMYEQAGKLQDYPEIATIMSDLSRFFVLDTEGNPHVPATPYRVFAGV